jgi:hypothetical protein
MQRTPSLLFHMVPVALALVLGLWFMEYDPQIRS